MRPTFIAVIILLVSAAQVGVMRQECTYGAERFIARKDNLPVPPNGLDLIANFKDGHCYVAVIFHNANTDQITLWDIDEHDGAIASVIKPSNSGSGLGYVRGKEVGPAKTLEFIREFVPVW